MDLLILLFVLYVIFSSLARIFRGSEDDKKKASRRPMKPSSSSSSGDIEKEVWDSFYSETKSKKEYHDEKKESTVSKHSYTQKSSKEADSDPSRRPPVRERKDSGEQEEAEKRIGKKDLKMLLRGEKLPLGIVASEVLGPPRSKRSFKGRKI